jgi:acetolactate synthase-1/2/3 large subunit
MAAWRALTAAPDIDLVCVRHEQAAAYAADGYARASGRLGVALVTTGPGAANTLGAVGEAHASGSPILVIATSSPAALRIEGVNRGALHETPDQLAFFGPVTKHRQRLGDDDDTAELLAAAGAAALAAPRGPAYLELPTDALG